MYLKFISHAFHAFLPAPGVLVSDDCDFAQCVNNSTLSSIVFSRKLRYTPCLWKSLRTDETRFSIS